MKCDKCNNEAKYFFSDNSGVVKRLCIDCLKKERYDGILDKTN